MYEYYVRHVYPPAIVKNESKVECRLTVSAM